MSGFDTTQDIATVRAAIQSPFRDGWRDAVEALDRLRVTLTATENALQKDSTSAANEKTPKGLDAQDRNEWRWFNSGYVNGLDHALAALAAARVVVSADRPSGPGCERHRGDPHNLCEACWALEPEPSADRPEEGT